MIHLDTSYLIRALVRGSPQDKRLREWLRRGEQMAMSAVAWAEFLCGPLDGRQLAIVAEVVSIRVPFDEEQAVLSAELFNRSGRRRGFMTDCMIAAAAIHDEAELATVNAADFRRLEGEGLELA